MVFKEVDAFASEFGKSMNYNNFGVFERRVKVASRHLKEHQSAALDGNYSITAQLVIILL
jgi:hypothetical protein